MTPEQRKIWDEQVAKARSTDYRYVCHWEIPHHILVAVDTDLTDLTRERDQYRDEAADLRGQVVELIAERDAARKTAAGYLSHIHEIKREWEQDTATLSRTAENWRARTHRLETLRSEARPQWARLLEALRAVEWRTVEWTEGVYDGECIACDRTRDHDGGHAQNCPVGNALAAMEAGE